MPDASDAKRLASHAARRRTLAFRSSVIPSIADIERSRLISVTRSSGISLPSAIRISSSMAIQAFVAFLGTRLRSAIISRSSSLSVSQCGRRVLEEPLVGDRTQYLGCWWSALDFEAFDDGKRDRPATAPTLLRPHVLQTLEFGGAE